MRRLVSYADLISGTYVALNNDSQVCPRSQCFSNPAREQEILHFNSKPPARHPRSDTSSTVLPISHRSPTSASFTAMPSVVKFSPN
jgi:hypothetical protein